MHREIKKETTAAQIVIRLLNGMLKGCEFDLASGKTLFIVAKENEVLTQQHLPIFPENTIFIPVTSAGSNFEINIDDQTPANVLLRELNNEDDSEKNKAASILFNQIITVGEVVFAVKEINSEWAEEILLYPGKEKEKTTPLPLAKKSRAALWCSLSAVTLISAIIVANFDYRDSKQKQSGELSSLLGDNEGKYHIFHGHDGWIYILANNEKEVAWARQSLIRLHFSKPVRVLSLQSEEQRIGLWLTENWPTVKYHRIRIETPQSPVILISEERSQLNDQQRAQLIKNLNQQIPYA
ncbi:hypothetical protein CCS41_08995 [Candidatus Fukatsuia symbiotica]|uniref:PrgH/EprH family type III secretion apparatus protein n=1 Tax=Candidatus Fukatsuia symbiotica TaxID=1878942 RepID=A0A2U8I5Y7_9GAMM|nr:hypothetical protein CCS41_08995 [Candidatus Fukatsuia symbiotica]